MVVSTVDIVIHFITVQRLAFRVLHLRLWVCVLNLTFLFFFGVSLLLLPLVPPYFASFPSTLSAQVDQSAGLFCWRLY